MNLEIRPGRPEDAEHCGMICFEAFKDIAEQHNFPPDFPSSDIAISVLSSLLSRQDIYSVVSVSSPTVVVAFIPRHFQGCARKSSQSALPQKNIA
jgi:hypothetical protein